RRSGKRRAVWSAPGIAGGGKERSVVRRSSWLDQSRRQIPAPWRPGRPEFSISAHARPRPVFSFVFFSFGRTAVRLHSEARQLLLSEPSSKLVGLAAETNKPREPSRGL